MFLKNPKIKYIYIYIYVSKKQSYWVEEASAL